MGGGLNPEFLRRIQLFAKFDDSELAEILMLGMVKEHPPTP
jgi:hypothetical protein